MGYSGPEMPSHSIICVNLPDHCFTTVKSPSPSTMVSVKSSPQIIAELGRPGV